MTRRLTSILLVWASLLGLAQPIMACAADMAASDCCSGDPVSGCMTGAMPALFADGSCCVATPAPVSSSFAAPLRSFDHVLSGGDSLSPCLAAQFDNSGGRHARALSNVRVPDAARRTDATLTYLYTARLRL
jgi:hypothetical protein